MAPIFYSREERLRKGALIYAWTLGMYSAALRIADQSKRIRRHYVRPLNLSRPITSEFMSLVKDFAVHDDTECHREYFRMDEERLRYLIDKLTPLIRHDQTHAMPIGPAFRVAMTLKILASGDSIKNTAKSYRIGYSTALQIFYETCEAFWTALQPEYLSMPDGDGWRKVATEFWNDWQFPLCLGAVDGKHVVIKQPSKAGSSYFNYKRDHSIVLMAVSDAKSNFIYVDIGGYGRNSDGGIFGASSFGKALMDEGRNRLGIPGFAHLPGTRVSCPHVFVGDAAFAIGPHMMKPFGRTNRDDAQRIFDYRLSRARRIVENAFGILVMRFRILLQPLACSPENAVKIVKALVVLHNFLKKTDPAVPIAKRYAPPRSLDYVDDNGAVRDGAWRHFAPVDQALVNLRPTNAKSALGKRVRDRLKEFFVSAVGRVPWQDAVL